LTRATPALVEFPGEAAPLVFASPVETIEASELNEVVPALKRVEKLAGAGRWCVGFVAYEAAPAFDPAMTVRDRIAQLPLVWFTVHDAPVRRGAAGEGAEEADSGNAAAVTAGVDWSPSVERDEFAAAVDAIREGIGRGDFYQINYTLRFRSTGGVVEAPSLYRRLRRIQPRAYAALLDTGHIQVVSASPELFFERRGSRLTTRPMKGTARRGRWKEEDDAAAAALAESVKERAENVMIVDLIRNDLGRIAEVGTVTVPSLFDVERHPTVLQMTSTVEATLRPGVDLAGIFEALFPCGSVTGAPKIAAMQAIARHEHAGRGVYCGAVGVVRPGGDATFSVAIRTATSHGGSGVWEYGAGGGITWDSDPVAERNEAHSKAAILVQDRPSFSLLETLRLSDGVAVRQERHLARMAASAEYFGFDDPRAAAAEAIRRAVAANSRGDHRLRVTAEQDGSSHAEVQPMPVAAMRSPRVSLCRQPVDRDDVFLYHKTTNRHVYESRRDVHPDAFDVLLMNGDGELTEFTLGNLVLQVAGRSFTPPRDAGLLAGVFRGALLDRGEVAERTLTTEDLASAERIWLVNSLREWVEVELAPEEWLPGP
jgi:para-aminobenzoate synthetase / 4-amino-4-deoxychorismate lyase